MNKLLTIREVSRRLNVTTHTLRFWEKEMEGIIAPLRTRGGQRRYNAEHLFILKEVIRLKGEGFSLTDIKEKLEARYNHHEMDSTNPNIEDFADRVAEIVRSAVYNFLETGKTD